MTAPFQTTRRVEFRDTDAAGLAHFSVFFNYMEEVEHELLRSLGLSVLMRDEQGTISWPRVSVHCEFHHAVRFEDTLRIEAWVERLGKKSVTYSFQFTHEGRPAAAGCMTSVCCRLQDGAAPQPIAIPQSVADKLASLSLPRDM